MRRRKIRKPVGEGVCGKCQVLLPLLEDPRAPTLGICAPCMDAQDLRHTIELKTWPQYFADVLSGRKTFELRQDDRRFSIGDILHLREWEPDTLGGVPNPREGHYTGQDCKVRVTYKYVGGGALTGGLAAGHCILGVVPVSEEVPGDDWEMARDMEVRILQTAGYVLSGIVAEVPADSEVEYAAAERIVDLHKAGETAGVSVSWKSDPGGTLFKVDIKRADGTLEKVGPG